MNAGIFPVVASAHAGEVDHAVVLVFSLIGVLFVGWLLFFTYTVFRFRASRQAEANHAGAKGKLAAVVEFAALSAEIALLVGISLPFWQRRVEALPGMAENPVIVRAVGQQFAWNFHYPGPDGIFGKAEASRMDDTSNPLGLDPADPAGKDDIVTRNQLHLPLGRPAIVEVTSKDVVHSFSLPDFRVKQDAVPGMRTRVSFTPVMSTEEYAAQKNDPTRTFEIVCAQLCGQGHYTMRGQVFVEKEEVYAKWLVDNAPKATSEADAFFN